VFSLPKTGSDGAAVFCSDEHMLNPRDDRLRQFVLYFEMVGKPPVVLLSPYLAPAFDFHKLCRRPQPRFRPAQTSGQQIVSADLASKLTQLDASVLVGKGRVARND